MAKDRWQWWKPGMTLTMAQRLNLLGIADKGQDGELPPEPAQDFVYGIKAIGKAAKVDNPSRFWKAMKDRLPIVTFDAEGTGYKRPVVATNRAAAVYFGMLYTRARRVAHKGKPRRSFRDIVDELERAIDPRNLEGAIADLGVDSIAKVEEAVLDEVEARYLDAQIGKPTN